MSDRSRARRRRRTDQPCRRSWAHHDRQRAARIFPHAVLGGLPQNAKHKGGRTTLIDRRELHHPRRRDDAYAAPTRSRGETTVGDNGNFLAYAHVAHDCILGNNVIMANGATLGGHVEVGDRVIIGGLTAVHQFARIGDKPSSAACSAISGDVIPYGMLSGNRAMLRGLNVVGMKRSGLPRAEIHAAAARLSADLRPHPADRREPRGCRRRIRRLARRP